MGNAFTADRERNITPKRKLDFSYRNVWSDELAQDRMSKRRKKPTDTNIYIPPKRGHNTERENNE